jgi:Concanavalin A-like lectin/glucanases superfamily
VALRSLYLLSLAAMVSGCELISLAYLQDGPRDGGLDGTVPREASPSEARAPRADVAVDTGEDDAGEDDAAEDAGALPYLVWYKFNGNTLDSSGRGVTGTLNGNASVSTAPGVEGTALSCESPGDGLSFRSTGFQPGTADFSIAFFYKVAVAPDGAPASPANTFFQKGGQWNNSNPPTTGVGMGYWTAAPYYLTGVVADGVQWDHTGYLPPNTEPLTDGRFHHFAFVVSWSHTSLTLYSDGVARGTQLFQLAPDGGMLGSLTSSDQGTLCSQVDPRWTLDGDIDDFMIIGKAISVSDIAGIIARASTDGG